MEPTKTPNGASDQRIVIRHNDAIVMTGIKTLVMTGIKMSKQEWLAVLTDSQRELRKQKRYDEINLTDTQKQVIGDEGCCWVESPSFYANSQWCM